MFRAVRRAAPQAALILLLACAPAWAGPVRSAGSIRGRLHVDKHVEYSSNWSGYATLGATFTSVEGSWTEPGADCAGMRGRQSSVASFWVGLDGYESSTVEQTGTDLECEGGQEYRVAWHEIYPQRSFVIPHEVSPGDRMTVHVTRETLRLEDMTRGWHYEESFLPRYDYSSAEWIVEAPASRLTNFGTVDFNSASTSDAETSEGPIDSSAWAHEELVMVSHSGKSITERAAPGALNGAGNAFVVEWRHS